MNPPGKAIMATSRSKSSGVDKYIADFPRPVQTVLRKVRSTIRKALPGAEETISYRIPAYKLDGRMVIYFAGWKQHYSLYPATSGVVAKFKREFERYEYNGKGTIRFPISEPVPEQLIAGIVKLRANENTARVKAKAAAAKKR